VCNSTVALYSFESSCTCFAPAIDPFIDAIWFVFANPFPALKLPPPFEN